MTRTTVRRALLGAAASIVLLLAAGCGSSGMNHDGMSGGPTRSGPDGSIHNDADVMFAQMMIPHHQQAVEMGTLAETRAQDAELKRLAADIKAAQQPEITTMTGWLEAWGAPTMAPGDLAGMSHGGHGGMPGLLSADEMAQLGAATGLDFDRLFARMMIAHHNGAIQMAEEHQEDGSNPDALALGKQIMKTQAAEVETLLTISKRL